MIGQAPFRGRGNPRLPGLTAFGSELCEAFMLTDNGSTRKPICKGPVCVVFTAEKRRGGKRDIRQRDKS